MASILEQLAAKGIDPSILLKNKRPEPISPLILDPGQQELSLNSTANPEYEGLEDKLQPIRDLANKIGKEQVGYAEDSIRGRNHPEQTNEFAPVTEGLPGPTGDPNFGLSATNPARTIPNDIIQTRSPASYSSQKPGMGDLKVQDNEDLKDQIEKADNRNDSEGAEYTGPQSGEPQEEGAKLASLDQKKPPTSDAVVQQALAQSKSLYSTDELKRLQQQEADVRKGAQYGRLGEILAGSIGGMVDRGTITKPVMGEYFKNEEEGAAKKTQDFLKQAEMEHSDPNSPISNAYRSFLAEKFKIDPKTIAGVPASQLDKIIPVLQRHEDKLLQVEAIKLRAQELKQNKELMRNDRQDKILVDRFDKMGKTIAAEVASSRSKFGKAANNVGAAERLEALATQEVDPNNLNNRQIYEMARGLDTMLSQGASTITGSSKLIPHTAAGSVASIAEYITSIPKGAKQGAFVKNMVDTIRREKSVAEKQIKESQGHLLSSYYDLQKKDPDKWDIVLRSHGLNPDLFKKGGSESSKQETPPKLDVSPKLPQLVKIRRKSDGAIKTLDSATAGRYLSDPGFEEVK